MVVKVYSLFAPEEIYYEMGREEPAGFIPKPVEVRFNMYPQRDTFLTGTTKLNTEEEVMFRELVRRVELRLWGEINPTDSSTD